jgi:hypothetical protein
MIRITDPPNDTSLQLSLEDDAGVAVLRPRLDRNNWRRELSRTDQFHHRCDVC